MHKSSNEHRHLNVFTCLPLLACALIVLSGCGAVKGRHVPKLGAITGQKMASLQGTPPIDVKSGNASSDEIEIGVVGLGKVMGKLSEWTDATVEATKKSLSARGATITPGAPKVLTITMTKAHVSAIPGIGVSTGKAELRATTPEGLDTTFEASNSSMAPLGAVDGAVEDALKKLLADATVDAYLRK